MDFLAKVEPHLDSEDLIVQEFIIDLLRDYPRVPKEWVLQLLQSEKDIARIFPLLSMQMSNLEVIELLLEKAKQDHENAKLFSDLCRKIEPTLALQYKEELSAYVPAEKWVFYELLLNGEEEAIRREYQSLLDALEKEPFYHDGLFHDAKLAAKTLVTQGLVTDYEIAYLLNKNLNDDYFSYEGILTIYMIGLLEKTEYISLLAGMFMRDEDLLLEVAADALISFQNDDVVRAVAPYLRNQESVMFAASVVGNSKSELAVTELRKALAATEEIDEKSILTEALAFQLSKSAAEDIAASVNKVPSNMLVDMEKVGYGYYKISELNHPNLDIWRNNCVQRYSSSAKNTTPENA
jgi:hypothetical protein